MWLTCPSELFSSFEIFPQAGDSASETANKLSRLLILLCAIAWYKYPEKFKDILVYGSIAVLTIYAIMVDTERLSQSKKEKFSPLTLKMSSPPSSVSQAPAVVSQVPPSVPASANQAANVPPSVPVIQEFIPAGATPVYVSHSTVKPSRENFSTLSLAQDIPVERPESSTPLTAILGAQMSSQPSQPSVNRLQLPLSVPSVNPMMRQDMLQVAPRQPQRNFTPSLGVNAKVYQAVQLPPRIMDSDFSDIQTNQPTDFNPLQDMGQLDERRVYTAPRPKSGLLLERTEDEAPLIPARAVATGNNRFYLQDVQPNVYSFSYDPTPINNNIGITYTPQIPPRTTRVMQTEDGRRYPLYTRTGVVPDQPEYIRADPQLVRDSVPRERLEEMPQRGDWSERQSQYEAAPSGVQSQVYDPRFTGYGDEYRGYQDIQLGNVRYYYTDVDAYRAPNFVIRNKVDHVDFQQPMGDIYSMYPREAALEDVREVVNNDWMAKSTEFREDLMERQMRKSNARQWQLRFAPRSKGANLSTFTSGY